MVLEQMSYPETKAMPATVEVGGIGFEDPYLWLEEEMPEVLAWQEAQNALAVEQLHSWPGFEPLRRRLYAHATDITMFAPVHCGPLWFQQTLPEDKEQRAVLKIAESVQGPWRVLVDPNAIESELGWSLDWFYPSPDGRCVAYGLSEGGHEESVLHVIETATGAVLPERIPYTHGGFVSWLPDSSAFYHNGTDGPHTETPYGRVYFHRLGETARAEPEPIEYGDLLCMPQVSSDGRYVTVLSGHLQVRPKAIKHLPDGEWQPFIPTVDGMCSGVFVGDEYIAVTTEGHPRGRLVAIPVESGADRSTWRELLPESDAVLLSVSQVSDRLVLGKLVDVQARLDILKLDGTADGSVPIPPASVVGTFSASAAIPWLPMVVASRGSTDFTFVHQTLRSSPAIFRFDVATRELEQVTERAREHPNFAISARFCESTGGERIPYFLLYRDDLDLSKPQPVLVNAYGGFNISTLPGYHQLYIEFVQAGGIFVLVHARGGSEYGTSWWMDGRAAVKQHTFDDVFAATEALIADGVTAAGQIGFAGFSNGGLLAGAVIAQRPDLFRAVVPGIPILDLMRMTRDPLTFSIARFEYGDPTIPEQAQWLYAYSPYHNLREGTDYPASLLVTGAADVRCPAWHSRKFLARLQASSTSGRPALMRILGDIGHMTGVSPGKGSEITAEWLGFLMQHLGLMPAEE